MNAAPPKDPGYTASSPSISANPVDITRWNIRFDKVDGTSFTLEDSRLFDLSKDERTSDFAGVITYTAEVQVTPGKTRFIDLGKVYGVSEVFVKAVVTVKVTTTLGNYMKSLKDNPTAMRWTSGQPLQPVGILGPVLL